MTRRALAISDRVVVMNIGGIEQIDAEDIYHRPDPLCRRLRRLGQSDRRRVASSVDGSGHIRFESTGGLMLEAYAAYRPRR